MASTSTRARNLWSLRERALRAALRQLGDEHGLPNKFTAAEVAAAIPKGEIAGAWSPAAVDAPRLLEYRVKEAGRRLWGHGRPSATNAAYPVRYFRNWFIVRGENGELFADVDTRRAQDPPHVELDKMSSNRPGGAGERARPDLAQALERVLGPQLRALDTFHRALASSGIPVDYRHIGVDDPIGE